MKGYDKLLIIKKMKPVMLRLVINFLEYHGMKLDNLIMDFESCVAKAANIIPTKGNIVKVTTNIYDPLRLSPPVSTIPWVCHRQYLRSPGFYITVHSYFETFVSKDLRVGKWL